MKKLFPLAACAVLISFGAFADCPKSYYAFRSEEDRKNDTVINARVGCTVIQTKVLDNCVAKKSISWVEYNNNEMIGFGSHRILFDGTTLQTERVLKHRGPLGSYTMENFARVSLNGATLCEKMSKDEHSNEVVDCEWMGELIVKEKCKDIY